MNLRSYPKVWNVGHRHISGLFFDPVWVQEKVDGSQFSAGVVDGQLEFRSKRAKIHPETADNLFQGAVETFLKLFKEDKLKEGWTYRGEALWRPKHNTIQYDRVPEGNVILFDVDVGLEDRLLPPEVEDIVASDLGLEVVPTLYHGKVESVEELKSLLEDNEPVLGGEMIEGVVAKNYERFSPKDGKMLMGKYVQPAFKEKHQKNWKAKNTSGGVVQEIISSLTTEARYKKAIQHLREDGNLQNAPQDIGPLMKEIHTDIEEEEQEYIKQKLYDAHIKKIKKAVASGLPNWYREKVLEELDL